MEGFPQEVIIELTLEEGLGVFCGSKGERRRGWEILEGRVEKRRHSPGIWASVSKGQRHKQHAVFRDLQDLIWYDCVL